MHAVAASLKRWAGGPALAAVLGTVLLLAFPASADPARMTEAAEDLVHVQKQERAASSYYQGEAARVRTPSAATDAIDRDADAYYAEQARQGGQRAEEVDRSAARYYQEQEIRAD